MTSYSEQFFRTIRHGSLRSAKRLVPALCSLVRPHSVLDLGCGEGTWLRVAQGQGVATIVGFDGSYVRPDDLQIEPDNFHAIDLLKGFPEPIRVDLAISLEVAEHLPESLADGVVEFLTACSDVVYFGAAIPGQGGTDHLNEQWQSYWADKFHRRGYLVSTALRDQFWLDPVVEVWYRQNALLYVKSGRTPQIETRTEAPDGVLLDVVHPHLYSLKMARYAALESLFAFLQKIVHRFRALS